MLFKKPLLFKRIKKYHQKILSVGYCCQVLFDYHKVPSIKIFINLEEEGSKVQYDGVGRIQNLRQLHTRFWKIIQELMIVRYIMSDALNIVCSMQTQYCVNTVFTTKFNASDVTNRGQLCYKTSLENIIIGYLCNYIFSQVRSVWVGDHPYITSVKELVG